jgi:gliding motility-associated protein GldC
MSNRNSELNFKISLDENNLPNTITWSASDAGLNNEQASAIIVSVFDAVQKDTLRLDLWVKDFPVDDMKKFIHQTIVSLAETFERATGDAEMTLDMKDFARYFAENQQLIKKN